MKVSKVVLAPVLAAALLTSGCGTSDQVAARVGSEQVTSSDVAVLSDMQCALVKSAPQQQGPIPVRTLRDASVDALVHMEVVGQLIEARDAGDYSGEALRQQLQGAEEALKAMPEDERQEALDLLEEYTKRELQLQQLAIDELKDQGVAQPGQQQVEETKQKLLEDYRKSIDVDVSPAFSPDDKGRPGGEDGSLSVPVSSYAKQAAQQQPDAAFVAGLPKSMRCG
ncbi:MAG TPA: hypothetical protein VFK34_00425 [Marmoricola sp.]|nr:hypothetical protein [Marmoricola sp.]